MLDGRIDIAVHSLKDVPYQLPDGIQLAAVPEREDSRDAFLSNGPKLHELKPGAVIGTSSLRRQVQLRHHFPALDLVVLRGNVDTRLRKLAEGQFDGIVLAVSGLKRLGHENRITQILDDDLMVSAVGQGALGIVCRTGDSRTERLLSALDHADTRTAVTAERALLRTLGGSCQIPVACKARIRGDRIHLIGLVASLDGKRVLREELDGAISEAFQVGLDLGNRLLSAGAAEILAEIIAHESQG